MVIFRYSAPSIAAFGEMGPIGERQEAARFRRARDGPSKTFAKSEKRRIKAESGWRFFWILFFGQAKKSISAVGPRTDIKINRRDSDAFSRDASDLARTPLGYVEDSPDLAKQTPLTKPIPLAN